MGREGISDGMGGVTNGKVLAFGGVEVQLPIFGPAWLICTYLFHHGTVHSP